MWHLHTSLRCCHLGAVAPRFLASFHRSRVVAVQALVLPGPAHLDISILTYWNLALGSCFLVRSPTIRRLPMGCRGWWFLYVSTFWNVVCLISWKSWITFFSESLVPSQVTFDSLSSSAPSIYMPGLIRKRGWECWSASSSTSLHGS